MIPLMSLFEMYICAREVFPIPNHITYTNKNLIYMFSVTV